MMVALWDQLAAQKAGTVFVVVTVAYHTIYPGPIPALQAVDQCLNDTL